MRPPQRSRHVAGRVHQLLVLGELLLPLPSSPVSAGGAAFLDTREEQLALLPSRVLRVPLRLELGLSELRARSTSTRQQLRR